MKHTLSGHQNKTGRKNAPSLLQVISSVEPTIHLEDKTQEMNSLQLNLPFLHTDQTDIGVADIEGKKSVYLRFFLEG